MSVKCKTQPECVWCQKKIRKWTDYHYIGHQPGPRFTTKAEVQALHNEQVVRVSYHYETREATEEEYRATGNYYIRTGPRWILDYATWDGESYHDDLFCGPKCAERYGRAVARHIKEREDDNDT